MIIIEPQLIPLSLYIHIPWCIKKCPYCDFNSHQLRGDIAEQRYLERLLQDLNQQCHYVQGRKLHSIFIGGGTPSLMSAEFYQRLLQATSAHIPLSDNIEITLEANPGTVEQSRFIGYRQAGINRLSLGIQSLNSRALKTLGRIHGPNEALKAIQIAKTAGFNNFNTDLMFGLPEQTIQDALLDLQQIVATQPPHISWYELTLEPGTHFYKKPPVLPPHDTSYQIQNEGIAYLEQQGYHRYEISAFAKVNAECRHNLNYWQFGDYLGIGAGAHSKVTLPENRIIRYQNHKSPQKYQNEPSGMTAETSTIVHDTLLFEYLMNAGRLFQPIEIQQIERRTGLSKDDVQSQLINRCPDELIHITDTHIQITEQGHRYLNELLNNLL